MDEQREGEINLETVAQVVFDARQNGLLVYFGITMEQAPGWFWEKYPDATMVYENGWLQNDPTHAGVVALENYKTANDLAEAELPPAPD